MKNLTKRQEEILNLIKTHILDLGFPPTRADIAKSLGFKSVIAPATNLKRMKDRIKGVDIIGVTNVGEVFHHLF